MLWAQLAASFIVWIGAGVVAWRTAAEWAADCRWPRSIRAIVAAGTLFLSGGLLLGALYGMQQMRAIADGTLTLAGWAAATLVGIIFGAMQAAAAALLMSVALASETRSHGPASELGEGKKHP